MSRELIALLIIVNFILLYFTIGYMYNHLVSVYKEYKRDKFEDEFARKLHNLRKERNNVTK